MGEWIGGRGQIYFIREVDRENTFTPFVKIGLVRSSGQRDSFDRLSEHQTGNPRLLHLETDWVVDTYAVAGVEAMLHRELAAQRINGEWFAFNSEKELSTAIDRTRALADEVQQFMPVFEEAERLKDVPSNGLERGPTKDERAWHEKLIRAKAELSLCSGLQLRITGVLERAIEVGIPIVGAGTTVSRTYSPRFQEAQFKAAHPDLYGKYLVELPGGLQRRFVLSSLEGIVISEETLSLTQEIDSFLHGLEGVGSALDVNGVMSLNEPNLRLEKVIALASWNKEVAEAHLKVALGVHEALTGVCKWRRYPTSKTQFDALRFAAEHPDLVQEFTSDPRVVEYVRRNRTLARGAQAAGQTSNGRKRKRKRP